jgi:hypothetical protein
MVYTGGEGDKVCEHLTVIIFDFEAYPEPKILTRQEIRALIRRFGTTVKTAKFLTVSQSFVWDRAYKGSL